jgi:hypothetical protein
VTKATGGRVDKPLAHFSRIEILVDTSGQEAADFVYDEITEAMDRLNQDLGVVGWFEVRHIRDLNAR